MLRLWTETCGVRKGSARRAYADTLADGLHPRHDSNANRVRNQQKRRTPRHYPGKHCLPLSDGETPPTLTESSDYAK